MFFLAVVGIITVVFTAETGGPLRRTAIWVVLAALMAELVILGAVDYFPLFGEPCLVPCDAVG